MNHVTKLISTFATKYDVEESKVVETLKNTAFRQSGKTQITNEQMTSLLVVASEYGLNPFTKEIYAFPSNGGIQPIVSIDGWMKIINGHKDFDGMEFKDELDNNGKITAVTCLIYRKNRTHPTQVTEYLSECSKNTEPWKKWPARMLRHKAAIQCARYAFSFSGIVDPDEGERIESVTSSEEKEVEGEVIEQEIAYYDEDLFQQNFPTWEKYIAAGKQTAEAVIVKVESKGQLTDKQRDLIMRIGVAA